MNKKVKVSQYLIKSLIAEVYPNDCYLIKNMNMLAIVFYYSNYHVNLLKVIYLIIFICIIIDSSLHSFLMHSQ